MGQPETDDSVCWHVGETKSYQVRLRIRLSGRRAEEGRRMSIPSTRHISPSSGRHCLESARYTNRWMDGWIVDGLTDEWMNERMDGWMKAWIYYMDGRIDRLHLPARRR